MPSPSHRSSWAFILGVLLVGSPLHIAHAEDDFKRYLDAAVQLYEELEYERALAQLQRARGVARGVAQDVTLGLHEGILLAELGRWDEARTSFETALLLDNTAKLPLAVSPKVQQEFESIRQRMTARRARKQPTPSPSTTPAPPGLTTDRPQRSPSRPSPLTPSESASVLTPTVEATPRRVPVVPLALLGAGAVAGGLGAYFGVSANQQYGAALVEPFRDDALSKFNQAQGSARTANVLFGTAGLALAGAVVTWFLMPGDASPSVPTDGGASR
ncbi:tetratricopeptide repeat protein [Archangium violaceum]|uniref:tetratricopeptide repeat protein n=1 Tax=Archangium violaceum TaxID=83451 RepID=UPI0007C7A028|nr:tetratricopeptide repeat protein [Archangium violaceum]